MTEGEKIDEELAYIQIKKLYLKMKIQSEFNVLFDVQWNVWTQLLTCKYEISFEFIMYKATPI